MAFTALTRAQLVQDVIAKLEDYGQEDWLAAAMNTGATSFTCTDPNYKQYKFGTTVEINQELMRVTANATTTAISVKRGVRGTSDPGTNYASGTMIRINPKYPQERIIRLMNTCVEAELEKEVVNDATTTTAANTYLYDMPSAITKENLTAIYLRTSNTNATARTGQRVYSYRVNKGQGTAGVDQLEFKFAQTAGLYITYIYRSGYTYLETDATSCDLPTNAAAQSLPVLYACAHLLTARETKRLRRDRNTFPEGATPVTARDRLGDWYMEEFKRIRRKEGLEPHRTRTRTVGW